jgi:hypothetical protein
MKTELYLVETVSPEVNGRFFFSPKKEFREDIQRSLKRAGFTEANTKVKFIEVKQKLDPQRRLGALSTIKQSRVPSSPQVVTLLGTGQC